MRKLAFLIACLACAGSARRVRFSGKTVKRSHPAAAQEPLKAVAKSPTSHSFHEAAQPKLQIAANGSYNPWRIVAMLVLILNTVAILKAYIRRVKGSLNEVQKKTPCDQLPSCEAVNSSELHGAALSASSIIKLWKRLLKTEAEVSAEGVEPLTEEDEIKKEKVESKMTEAQNILNEMTQNLKRATPHDIVGLATKDKTENLDPAADVFVLAMINNHFQKDDTGKLKDIAEKQGLIEASAQDGEASQCCPAPVIVIGEVVAKPTKDRMAGLGKELLLRIVRHAATMGRLVVLSPASEWLLEYYQTIGFEPIDSADRVGPMVYSKPLPEIADNEHAFQMVRLRLA